MSGSAGRIAWIDTLRGIGIIFVVICHGYSGAHPALLTYVFSFHIPLFFFLAGYVFQCAPSPRYGAFFLRKFKTRIVPYVIFYFIYYGSGFLILKRETGLSITSVLLMDGREKLAALLVADRTVLDGIGNVALWFLPNLFIAENIVFLIRMIAGKMRSAIPAALALLSIIAYGESVKGCLGLHATAVTALTAAVFYGCGSLAKAIFVQDWIVSGTPRNKILIWLAATSASVAISLLNGRVDMSTNSYGNYLYFYTAAFSGILCYAYIAQLFSSPGWLAYLGRNSLIISCLHLSSAQATPILYLSAVSFFSGIDYTLIQRSSNIVFLEAASLDILTIVLIIPCIHVINTLIPAVIGRQKQRTEIAS